MHCLIISYHTGMYQTDKSGNLRTLPVKKTLPFVWRAMPIPLLSVPWYTMGWQIDCYIRFLLPIPLGTCKTTSILGMQIGPLLHGWPPVS